MNRDQDHLIDTYREFDIYYVEDEDKFVCEMVAEDSHKTTSRSSLKSLKQEVDKFIKANANFKPFKVMRVGRYSSGEEYNGSVVVMDAVGVRKDGALILEADDEYRKDKKDRNYVKYEPDNSYRCDECKGYKYYNPEIYDIQKEWDEHEKQWQTKQEELRKKASKILKTIDWKYISSFSEKNYKSERTYPD